MRGFHIVFLNTQGVKRRAPSVLSGFHSLGPGRRGLVLAHYNRKKLILTTIKESASESVCNLSPHTSVTSHPYLFTFMTCGHGSLISVSVTKKFESCKLDSKFLSLDSFSSLSLISLSVFYDANFLSAVSSHSVTSLIKK